MWTGFALAEVYALGMLLLVSVELHITAISAPTVVSGRVWHLTGRQSRVLSSVLRTQTQLYLHLCWRWCKTGGQRDLESGNSLHV